MKNFFTLNWFERPLHKLDLKVKLSALFFLSAFFCLQANEGHAEKVKATFNFETMTELKVIDVTNDSNKALQTQITGTIKDAAGQPLPGANVLEKGTKNGVTSDFDGNFSITVSKADAILVVSFVGFTKQDVPLNGSTQVNVTLEESTASLDEVVVVGFGTQKKVNLTGAVATLSADDLVDKSVIGTIDAMQGQLPGVTILRQEGGPGNEDLSIQIRGLTSVNDAPVLVMVDGIEGDINDVRPEDVESISVLKDAASSAIYGAKAAGGVILVTTKGGKAGKMKIEYNSYYSIAKLGRTSERIPSLRGAQLRNEAEINAGRSAVYSQEQLDKIADPNYLWEEDTRRAGHYTFYGDYNYPKLLIEDSPMQSHNIAVSGGNEKTTYRLSSTYFDNQGAIKFGPDSNKKYSGRLNLKSQINKYLNLATVLSYEHNYVEKPFTNPNGNFGFFAYTYTYLGTAPYRDPNGHLTDETRFGSFDYERGIKERRDNTVRANATLTVENLFKGFRFRVVGGIQGDFDNIFEHGKQIPRYLIDGVTVDGRLPSGPSLKKGQANTSQKEIQLIADYDLNVGDHNVFLLGGYSVQDYRREGFDASQGGQINSNIPSFDWSTSENINLNDEIETNRFQSVFGRVQYNYKEKYLLEGSFRYDGSSKLVPGDQYRFFPSASLAWRISEEDWFSVDAVDQFKIRASMGSLGNAGGLRDNYSYIPLLLAEDDLVLGYSGGLDNQAGFIYQSTLASKEISWETVQDQNIGIDLGLFGNKLNFSADYYVKRNKDMLAAVAYPSVIGMNLGRLNVGELKTWGWEANIGWQDKKGDFKYYFNANIGDSENELIEYIGSDVINPGTTRLLEGFPVNSIWGYENDGLFQSDDEVAAHAFQNNRTGAGDVKFIDQNGDGVITTGRQTVEDPGDLKYLGNTNPRYNFGIGGGFDWKDLDFSIFFQGVGKRTFMMDNAVIQPYWRPYMSPRAEHLDYWTEDNRDAFWPRIYRRGDHNFVPNDRFIQDAAYIRLKDLQIGYSIPERLIENLAITRFRVYIGGRDLWESTKTFDFIDPETPNVSRATYPFRRTYTIGLNVSF